VPLRPRWAIPAVVTAVAAVAATVALAIWATSLSSQLGNERDARHAQERAAAIVGDPAARRVKIEGGRGSLVVTPTGQGALVLSGLNPAPSGKTYEAWVAEGGSPKPAGTFDGGGDVTAFALSRPVPDGATVMVTVEKNGGVGLPTQMPFVTVRNSSSA
jgi:anti-sigma-K factor RskA